MLQRERKSISVVIVVWNAKKYVLECLESLREHCANTYREVIVVDNASTDGTPDLIEKLFPESTLIRNQQNLGFATANNIGISLCSGDYICLVNSDVKFRDDCLVQMVRYMAENPDVAMLGPRMLWPDGRVRRSTMRFPTVWNMFSHAAGLHVLFKRSSVFAGQLMSDFDHQSTREVEVLNGWFVMVRRTALQKVGPMDPSFFMYGEDIDWCYRFRQAGERLVFFADAGAIHYGGASSSNAPVRFYIEMNRAMWQYWRKHYGKWSQLAFLLTSAIHDSLRLLRSACGYLCLPSARPQELIKLKRHFACLQWVGHLAIGHDRNPQYRPN